MWTLRPIFSCVLVGLMLGGTISCHKDPNQTKLTYMPDMADCPIAKPQLTYLDPPLGAVAMNAILYPKDAETAGQVLQNPLVGTNDIAKVRREGRYLYDQVCVACHGEGATGKSAISDVYPAPPDLTLELYRGKSDGFFFHRITFGSAVMPFQGDKLDPLERWKVIMYLRELQETAATKG